MREQGTIKWFRPKEGYGFIVPANGGPDVMLYATLCLQLGLKTERGMRVEYEAVQTRTGLKAVWVGGVR